MQLSTLYLHSKCAAKMHTMKAVSFLTPNQLLEKSLMTKTTTVSKLETTRAWHHDE